MEEKQDLNLKKIILAGIAVLLLNLSMYSQVSEEEIRLLHKLDSARNSGYVARYFAALYFNTTVRAVNDFEHDEDAAKKFIQRMETRFAHYFFNAAEAFIQKKEIPPVWKAYFSDTSLSPLQYQLLGINAHINGDIWKALTTEFSFSELQENKKAYFQFNKGLTIEYRRFYDESFRATAKTALLDNLSLGLSRLYGKSMLVKWRKRQMQLALLYFSDRTKFDKEITKVNRKMEHINNLILHNL